MSGRIVPTGSGPGVTRVTPRRRVSGRLDIAPARAVEPVDGTAAEDVRLIVEDGGEAGEAVYLMVDRRNGRVLRRHTSAEVRRMTLDPDYAPGEVVDTKA